MKHFKKSTLFNISFKQKKIMSPLEKDTSCIERNDGFSIGIEETKNDFPVVSNESTFLIFISLPIFFISFYFVSDIINLQSHLDYLFKIDK